VRNSMKAVQNSIPPLQELVALLKLHGIVIEIEPIPSTSGNEDALEFLEQSPMIWESIVNSCFKVKEAILPHQLSIVSDVKAELNAFALKVQDFSEYFYANGPFQHGFTISDDVNFAPGQSINSTIHATAATGAGAGGAQRSSLTRRGTMLAQLEEADMKASKFTWPAYHRLNELHELLYSIEVESVDYEEVRGLFEIPIEATMVPTRHNNSPPAHHKNHNQNSNTNHGDNMKALPGIEGGGGGGGEVAMKTSSHVLRELRTDLRRLKHVWDLVSRVQFTFNRWSVAMWQDMDIDLLVL
jgi:hypothetical protein